MLKPTFWKTGVKMLKEKERETLNRIIKILLENEEAIDIFGIKIENLIALKDMWTHTNV